MLIGMAILKQVLVTFFIGDWRGTSEWKSRRVADFENFRIKKWFGYFKAKQWRKRCQNSAIRKTDRKLQS